MFLTFKSAVQQRFEKSQTNAGSTKENPSQAMLKITKFSFGIKSQR